MRPLALPLALALALVAAGCSVPEPRHVTPPPGQATPGWDAIALRLEPVLSGLAQPVLVVDAGDGSGRLFVVEQGGLVRIATSEGKLADAPFLDLTALTRAGGERGLLGLAFSPRYEADGRLYVSYTDVDGDSVLARYHVSADADRADPASAETLLHVDQPYANHNGGNVVFGPDGYLYFGLGDGGSGGDPQGNGQDPSVLLASMLRLDVSGERGYAVPPDNPFVHGGGKPEVWAKGLRNPWRFSFDRATGDLWIGDVGQNAWEEIDLQPRASHGGENYGWSVWEGNHRYAATREPTSPVTAPVAEYSHDDGCSVTGGYVMRDPTIPAANGAYLYADYCSGKLWGLRPNGTAWEMRILLETGLAVSSFGEDAAGHVYVVDHGGGVYRVAVG